MIKLTALIACLTVLTFPALAEESISIKDAFSYQTAPQQMNGAVFAHITNHTDQDLKIIKAESGVASMVELHTHSMEDGHMSMFPVEYFKLPANASHDLKPAGDHIMLMMLNAPLEVGKNFDVTITLDNGKTHVINVPVKSLSE